MKSTFIIFRFAKSITKLNANSAFEGKATPIIGKWTMNWIVPSIFHII